MRTQPQILIDSFANTPKDGVWYLAGSNTNAETVDLDKGTNTVVSWDDGEHDWKFMTFRDGTVVSSGMVDLDKTFEDEE